MSHDASLTDAEYPDTDVESSARNRYTGGGTAAGLKASGATTVRGAHEAPLFIEDEGHSEPPPLLHVPTVIPATHFAPHQPHAQAHSQATTTAVHQPPATPAQFQAHQNAMVQHFRMQQRDLLQQMTSPEYQAETDRLFAQLPPAVQKDLTHQLQSVPPEMRIAGRGQMTRQALSWARDPNTTFLASGVKRNNLSLVRMCLEELGANVDYVDEDGNSGLHWAVWYKIAPMAEYLISRGAQIDCVNSKGQTPVHWACMGGNLACVRVLVKARCRLDVQDKDGYYPTHAAAQHGKTAVLEYLKLNGADLHAVDFNSRTVLHWSAFKNELITTQYLVGQGLSLAHADTGGRLALHWAASQNNIDIVSYLVGVMEEQADFSALDAKDITLGLTPRELAHAKNSYRVLAYLTDVEKRLKLSPWKKFVSRLFCLNQHSWFGTSKIAGDTSKSKLGFYITIWYHALLSLSCLHHWFVMLPTLDEEADLSATFHRTLILMEFGALIGWSVVHRTNPGYLPKNLAGMKTAFDRGNNPGGSPIPTIASSPQSRVESPHEDDTATERTSMIQMEELGGEEKITPETFTYEQCLERGYADFICVTCRIVKPLRSKHCQVCDRCVKRFDHHCPWVDTCIGEGNHPQFVLFLVHMMLVLSLFAYVCWIFLYNHEENRTFANCLFTLVLGAHAVFMTLYAGILLFSQGPMIFHQLTTNEQFNGWRYKYMKVDPHDPKRRKLLTPFSEGRVKNCLTFFRCRREKHVAATVEMASTHDAPTTSTAGGGEQLDAPAFEWAGIDLLQQGLILTPENEQQVHAVLRYTAFQKAMSEQQGWVETTPGGHAHGSGHAHAGHGHSHGGKPCQGH